MGRLKAGVLAPLTRASQAPWSLIEDAANFWFSVMAGLRPGHPRPARSNAAKTWMPGIADKFYAVCARQTATAGHDELYIWRRSDCCVTCALQHPLQMLGTPSPSSLSCSLTAARAAAPRNLDAANRVRLIFLTDPCTGGA